MFQTDMSLVLLQPDVSQTACLPNVDQTTHTGDAVYSRCLQFQVVLDRLKETGYFAEREARRLDVVLREHRADAVEYQSDIRQESSNLAFGQAGQPSGEG
jgi:hypothetical protein